MKSAYRIECASCGITSAPVMCKGVAFPPEFLARQFTNKGWEVGKKDGSDTCPSCVSRRAEDRRRQLHLVEKETEVEKLKTAIVADAPREMTREDRRIILSKLDEVYISEAVGYDRAWTDKKVAEDLGIPKAWVAKLREENFGPATNEDIEEFLQEARSASSDARELNGKIADIEKAMARLMIRTQKVEKIADGIEKAVR